MDKDPLHRIGIIGCGAVVQSYYTKVLPLIQSASVARVCDLNRASAEKVAESLGARAGTIDEVVVESDICVIATPPASHYELVAKCLDARRDVFCEKPFVGTRTEAEKLCQKASEVGRRIYVGHFRRNYPSVDMAKSLIATGALGPVTELSVFEGGRFSWNTASSYVSSDRFGGVLYDTGSHAMDMALYASGLDAIRADIKDVHALKDKEEPSHLFKGALKLETAMSSVFMRVHISRYEPLANIIRIKMAYGTVEFSTGLDSSVTVAGPKGRSVLRALRQYSDPFQCFRRQFDLIFAGEGAIFDGSRFTNLTAALEALATAQPEKKLCHELR